ncbi:hypothetical protein DH2020_006160 [Rehmannia glutinosa]|uniref:Mitochondrial carrier protein n=1 Tax=Rehmannia glutinosa TaxID=99300 RepID=A0ABR0XI72_REHGL
MDGSGNSHKKSGIRKEYGKKEESLSREPSNFQISEVDLSFGERAFSAGGAAFISALIVNPLDVAKTRLQAQAAGVSYDGLCRLGCFETSTMLQVLKYVPSSVRSPVGNQPACSPDCTRYRGTLDVFYKIIQQEGFSRLWRGTNASLALAVPSAFKHSQGGAKPPGVWKTLNGVLRRRILSRIGDEASVSSVLGANFCAGFVAGSVAAAVTCPLDVARTRRQIEVKDPTRALTMTTRQTLIEIWRDGGVKGLFTGAGPRVARAGPSVGIVVSFYEAVKYAMQYRYLKQ